MTDEQKAAVDAQVRDGRISCRKALELAEKLGVKPLEVGAYLDETGVKVKGCQLGCFR